MVADAVPSPIPHCFDNSAGVSLDCLIDEDTLACTRASPELGSETMAPGAVTPDPVPKSRACSGLVSRLEHARLSEGVAGRPSRSRSMLGSWATMMSAEAM
jgi:hypothetical protein